MIPLPVLLQVIAPPVSQDPAAVPDPNAIIDAIKHHSWVLLAATLVYWTTAIVKQGWVGPWLQSKLPARWIPFVVPIPTCLLLATGEIIAGKPWQSALLDGFFAGVLPVFGHQVLVESMRNGKEVVPAKTPPAAPPAPPSLTDMPTLPNTRIGTKSNPPPPAAARTETLIMRNYFIAAFMPVLFLFAFLAVASMPATACTPAQAAVFGKVEMLVLDGLAKGESAEQIESQVAAALCPGVVSVPGQYCVDAVIVLNDVLTFLIDANVIPSNIFPRATAMKRQVEPLALAHRAAGHP